MSKSNSKILQEFVEYAPNVLPGVLQLYTEFTNIEEKLKENMELPKDAFIYKEKIYSGKTSWTDTKKIWLGLFEEARESDLVSIFQGMEIGCILQTEDSITGDIVQKRILQCFNFVRGIFNNTSNVQNVLKDILASFDDTNIGILDDFVAEHAESLSDEISQKFIEVFPWHYTISNGHLLVPADELSNTSQEPAPIPVEQGQDTSHATPQEEEPAPTLVEKEQDTSHATPQEEEPAQTLVEKEQDTSHATPQEEEPAPTPVEQGQDASLATSQEEEPAPTPVEQGQETSQEPLDINTILEILDAVVNNPYTQETEVQSFLTPNEQGQDTSHETSQEEEPAPIRFSERDVSVKSLDDKRTMGARPKEEKIRRAIGVKRR